MKVSFYLNGELAQNLRSLSKYYCTDPDELICDALEEFFQNHAADLEQARAESEADEL